MIHVAIVEDDSQQRASLTSLLAGSAEVCLVGCWGTAEEAIPALPLAAPDVALVDIQLPGQSGIELVRQLRPILPNTQFMMLTVLDDAQRVFAALRAGATGYLLKKAPPDRLLAAIHELHAGESPMSGVIARKVIAALAPAPSLPAPKLSPREAEVLDLLGRGHLYKEIAETLGIGLGTVRTHIRRIYEKLQVHNRSAATRRGLPEVG